MYKTTFISFENLKSFEPKKKVEYDYSITFQ